jgi:hypothetical protein
VYYLFCDGEFEGWSLWVRSSGGCSAFDLSCRHQAGDLFAVTCSLDSKHHGFSCLVSLARSSAEWWCLFVTLERCRSSPDVMGAYSSSPAVMGALPALHDVKLVSCLPVYEIWIDLEETLSHHPDVQSGLLRC